MASGLPEEVPQELLVILVVLPGLYKSVAKGISMLLMFKWAVSGTQPTIGVSDGGQFLTPKLGRQEPDVVHLMQQQQSTSDMRHTRNGPADTFVPTAGICRL